MLPKGRFQSRIPVTTLAERLRSDLPSKTLLVGGRITEFYRIREVY